MCYAHRSPRPPASSLALQYISTELRLRAHVFACNVSETGRSDMRNVVSGKITSATSHSPYTIVALHGRLEWMRVKGRKSTGNQHVTNRNKLGTWCFLGFLSSSTSCLSIVMHHYPPRNPVSHYCAIFQRQTPEKSAIAVPGPAA